MVRSPSIRLVLIVAALSLLIGLPARPAERRVKRVKMDPILHRLVRGQGIDNQGQRKQIDRTELKFYARSVAIDAESDRPTASVRMRLDAGARATIESMGITTYGAMPDFASAVIPIDRLAAVSEVSGVDRMQLLAIPELELDVSVPDIGADMAWNDYNARGQGVILGLIDTGSDVTHEDLVKTDGTTRFHMVWYQDDRCTGTPPPFPFNFGCLFTEGEINDHINGIDPIDFPDADGHGTHVMSTAAGDGSATGESEPPFQYVGPANEAGLITVKVFPEPGLAVPCTTCFRLSLALDFIDFTAASLGMEYVVNMSLGSSLGSHDGFDLDEVTIDTLTGPGKPGKVVVKSAGNNRGVGLHASGVVAEGDTNNHTFTIPDYSPLPGAINDAQDWMMWYEAGDNMTVTISDPPGQGQSGCRSTETVSCTTGSGRVESGTTSGRIFCDETDIFDPPVLDENGDNFFFLEINDNNPQAPCPGTWTFSITGNTITEGGAYDLYIWFSSFGASGLRADWAVPDHSQVISIPGTANYVTTVGAYKTKQSWTSIDTNTYSWVDTGAVGDFASFSSNGPTRDGRLKPEIMAPGFGVVGALSIDIPGSQVGPGGLDRPLVAEDGVHWILPGTSFSAPHVAGVYAQMLGVNPNLDAVQLRTLITTTASTDGFTEAGTPTPNNDWGHGKVNVPAAFEALIKKIPDLAMSTTGGMWTGIATADTYNVYRANVAALDGTFFGTCLQSGLPTPDFVDTEAPASGQAWAFYVTGVADGVEGLIRIEPDGTGVPPSNPCP